MDNNQLKLFESKEIRTSWNNTEEKWYFSIVDVVAVLTESTDPTAYWRKLKQRLIAEGNETVTNCHALKMIAKDGKNRKLMLLIQNNYYVLFNQYLALL